MLAKWRVICLIIIYKWLISHFKNGAPMVFGIDFHQVFVSLTSALGPLCVLYAPTLMIERAVLKILRDKELN